MKGRRQAGRRVGLIVAGAALLAGGFGSSAKAEGASRFRAVVVDASRVARLGSPVLAERVRGDVSAEVRRAFGDLLAPGDVRAPTLVVRIDSISLGSFTDNTIATEGNNKDYLEGAGIVSANGRVLSTTPVLSVLNPGYSGAWYAPGIDERRVQSISHHFASWLRREMGL